MKHQNILSRKKVISQRVIANQSTNIIIKNVWFKTNPHLQERLILIQIYIPYCTICGKINERFKGNKSIVKDYIREVNSPDEGIYKKYHDKLPVFFVEDIYKEKYVNLKQNNN